MTDDDLNPAVVLHMTATGLAIARSLGRRGVPVYGVDCHKFEIGHKSKFVLSSDISYIPYENREIVSKLIDFAKKYFSKKPVLYFAGDEYLYSLIDSLEILNQYYIMPKCYGNGSAKDCLNKAIFYEKCNKLKLDIPATAYLTNDFDISQLPQDIEFPVLLKPVFGHKWKDILAGKKVFVINNIVELNTMIIKHQNRLDNLMLQELIPGGDESIYQLSVYIDDSGNPMEIMCSRKVRQHPNQFGIGSCIKSVWMDDLVQIGLKDLAKLGFKGICDIEYKYDIRNNRWRLIEINPRVGMYFALCEFVGVNLIWNSYCDFIGRKDMLEKSKEHKDGLSWQYLSRDIPSVFQKILQHTAKKKDLIEFMCLNKKIEPILSYRDIICVAYYPFYIIQKIFQF